MAAEPIIPDRERAFVGSRRVAHLATADRHGRPHVVPICFVLAENTLYSTIDEKPKATARLKRLSNIAENSATAVVVDRYDEDWALLGWVMLRGRAEILFDGAEHDRAQMLLRGRYRQLRAMHIAPLAVIALRIERVTSWGNLHIDNA
jgi:PPOX class probable F420-dependent enzyme